MTHARARNTDPETSHEAARRAEKTGVAFTQRSRVYTALQELESRGARGWTAAEIALQAGLDRYVASRRLPELRERGLVLRGDARVCHVIGSRCSVWFVSTKGGGG